MCTILHDKTLRNELFKTKGSNGFVFQKDIYLINLIKRKHQKRSLALAQPSLSIKAKKLLNLPQIILTTKAHIDDQLSDRVYLSNRLTDRASKRFTVETSPQSQKKTLLKETQQSFSSSNIHRQFLHFTSLIPSSSSLKYKTLLKNKEILALLEKNKKLNDD